MLLDARAPERPAGMLVDRGIGKRIPFARKVDFDTGEYEAFAVGPDGESILLGEWDVPVVVRGRAVGKLELVPIDQAHVFGLKDEPATVRGAVQPMSADQRLSGLEQYKEVYVRVWNEMRKESRRCVEDRWGQFLATNDFLDCFILKRRPVTAG